MFEECLEYVKNSTQEQVATRLSAAIRAERSLSAMVRAVQVFSSNTDFAMNAGIPELEWALGRSLRTPDEAAKEESK